MSTYAVSWVLHKSEAVGRDRLILIALADEADNDGLNARPSIRRLARMARVHRNTAQRCVGRLELAGEILVLRPEKQGRGHFNRYAVTMGRDAHELAAALGWPGAIIDATARELWAQEEGHHDAPLSDNPHDGENDDETVDNPTLEAMGITDIHGDNDGENPDPGPLSVPKGHHLEVTDPLTQNLKTNPRAHPHPTEPENNENQDVDDAFGAGLLPDDARLATPEELAERGLTSPPDYLFAKHEDARIPTTARALYVRDADGVLRCVEFEESKAAPKAPAAATEAGDSTRVDDAVKAHLIQTVTNACRGMNRNYVTTLAKELVEWALASGIPPSAIEGAAFDADHKAILPTYLIPNLVKRAERIGLTWLELPTKLQPKGTE